MNEWIVIDSSGLISFFSSETNADSYRKWLANRGEKAEVLTAEAYEARKKAI